MSVEETWIAMFSRPLMGHLATRDAAYKNCTVPAIKADTRKNLLAVLDECMKQQNSYGGYYALRRRIEKLP